MAQRPRDLTPGYTIVYPNRRKASSHSARVIVVVLLIVSVVLMAAITVGGWSRLQGMKPVNFAWMAIYLTVAYYVTRWARGLLPIAAALGIVLLILAIIAATGYAGTSWFDRSADGFGAAQSMFGGSGFSADTLGLLTWLLVPSQAALIIFGMIAFSQGWNVEQEVPIDEARRIASGGRGDRGGRSQPPAPAATT